MLPALIAGGLGLAGSIYSSNKAADAAAEANSGDLPDWLKPYVVGKGPVPPHISGNPKINTNWLDYITQLGNGNADAPWAPMTANSPWFQPDQTFTPEEGGGQYGSLPPDFEPYTQPAPPPQQAGGGLGDIKEMQEYFKKRDGAYSLAGEGNAGYHFSRKRNFPDMDQQRYDELGMMYDLIRGDQYSNNG